MALFGEIAVLLETKSRGGTNIMYYSAKNGQYLWQGDASEHGSRNGCKQIIISCIGRNTGWSRNSGEIIF